MDWGLFKRAIEDNENPTPGYMFREMAQWTFKDYSTQMKLIHALCEKLKPNVSVHVLYKVLRIIKMICKTGHGDFQKEMQKNSRVEEIKVFSSYRGKPDATHGDSLNEKVRQSAREAVEAIFTPQKEECLTIEVGNGGGNFGGVTTERSTFTTGNLTGGQVVGGAIGMYSNNIAPMPATNKWAEHMAEQAVAGTTSTASRVFSTIAEKAKSGFGLIQNPVGGVKYQSAKDQLYDSAFKLSITGSTLAGRSTTDTGTFQPVELNTNVSTSPEGDNSHGEWKFLKVEGIHDAALQVTGEGSGVAYHHQMEELHQKQLTPFQLCVQRLCQMKSTPQRVELHSFVKQCCEVGSEIMRQRSGKMGLMKQEDVGNCWEELAEALDTQLAQKHPWQHRLNVLVAMEAIFNTRNGTQGDDAMVEAMMRREVMEYFLENPEDVRQNISVVQATLREAAQRVLKLLGLECKVVAASGGGGRGSSSSSSSRTNNTNESNFPSVTATTTTTTTVGASPFFLPMSETQKIQSAGNAMQTYTWSAPVPQSSATMGCSGGGCSSNPGHGAPADLSGMTVRAKPFISKDKRTLKSRPPMRLSGSGFCEDNDGASGIQSGIAHDNAKCSNSSFFFSTKSLIPSDGKQVGGEGVMQDLFSGLAPSETGNSVSTTTFHAGTETSLTPAQAGVSSVSHGSGTREFDFLMTGSKEESVVPFASPPLQQQQKPFCSDVTSRDQISSIFCTPSLPSSGYCGGIKSNINTGLTASASLLSDSSLFSPVAQESPSNVLAQMQQQLQTLMTNSQHTLNPAAFGQLQSLVAQQQQMIALMSQQQAMWNVSSHDAACGMSSGVVSTHSHFGAKKAFSMPSAPASSPASTNTFAEIQQEMMARMAEEKP